MKLGSLFSGYGGLDRAVEKFYSAETVWVSDIDPGANRILNHRYPDVPNLGDITTVDWAQVESVDIITGGWPCQPFSLAGKRKGAEDDRALWPHVARAIRALRPQHIVLENVAAIATAGELSRATADLASLGYVGSWLCLRAADVGAPHGRARIFITATNTQRGGREWRGADGITWPSDAPAGGCDPTVADTERLGWDGRTGTPGQGRRLQPPNGSHAVAGADSVGLQRQHHHSPQTWAASRSVGCGGGGIAVADTEGDGRNQRRTEPTRQLRRPDAPLSSPTNWGAYGPAIRRWESALGRLAPPPTETSPKGAQRLSPRFVEWMMGLPEGWVTDVPGLNRNAQLKALGNGVVPQQAYAALQQMHGTVAAQPSTPCTLLPTPRAQNGEERNQSIWARPLDQPQNLENALARLSEDGAA